LGPPAGGGGLFVVAGGAPDPTFGAWAPAVGRAGFTAEALIAILKQSLVCMYVYYEAILN